MGSLPLGIPRLARGAQKCQFSKNSNFDISNLSSSDVLPNYPKNRSFWAQLGPGWTNLGLQWHFFILLIEANIFCFQVVATRGRLHPFSCGFARAKTKILPGRSSKKFLNLKTFLGLTDHFKPKKFEFFGWDNAEICKNVKTLKMAISQLFVDIFSKCQNIK